jgi:hypothetical protein
MLNFTRGLNKKPVASELLQKALSKVDDFSGDFAVNANERQRFEPHA